MVRRVPAVVPDAVQKLRCPFCGQEESERAIIEGQRLIIFPCMFSPLVDANLPEEELGTYLHENYGGDPGYFRRQCDRLHLAVVKAQA